ncbi:hypothetical protein [Phytohabitans rumicis]|uniref:Uncharacterized protein n=1 Tax=Phytohabitans rumicis TaxID=1076125 RepID=A0A6V8KYU4_9ACTN|nr:hypothetical protein [Phytohabitans rumicis]GFJ87489.1 hypothetical protein Prum_011310 [Phytohabitans rumicis]
MAARADLDPGGPGTRRGRRVRGDPPLGPAARSAQTRLLAHPGEPKPLYLDLDSPILVGLFATTVRRPGGAAVRATISEMLPAPDQLWLRDAEGRRYTSELRLAAVEASAAGRPS